MQDFPAVSQIKAKIGDFKPKVGLILGSGLGAVADAIEPVAEFSYQDLEGFPCSNVAGHAGKMKIGTIGGLPLVCLQGRVHFYEGNKSTEVKLLIRTLKQLGCETLILTNAAGSFRKDVPAGDLMLIEDHVNFQGTNPLIGLNDDEFGPRFVSLDNAYDKTLREKVLATAQSLDMPLKSGVYFATIGPGFETHAEIRAFKALGADAVGMSTVGEVLVARHCDMKVVAISAITNMAAGLSDEVLSHDGTLEFGAIAAKKLTKLLINFIPTLN